MIIRPSKPADAAQVAPLIDIVFTEMEIPQLMRVPKPTLYAVLQQAFLAPLSGNMVNSSGFSLSSLEA